MASRNPFEGRATPVDDEEEVKNPFAGRATPVADDEEEYSALERGLGFVSDNVSKGLQKLGNVVPSLVNFGNAAGFYGYNKPLPEAPMVGDKLREATKAAGLSDVEAFQPEGTAQELLAKGIQGAASSPFGPLSMASGAVGEIGAHYGKELAGTPGEIAGGVGGSIAGGGMASTASKAANFVKGGPTGKVVYDAMKEEGVTPRLIGDATTDSLHKPDAWQQTTAFLGQVPILGRPISKAVDDTVEEIAAAKQRLQQQIGVGTMDDVAFGQHVQQGLDDSLRNFRQTADHEYARLKSYVQPTDLFSWNNTMQTLDKLSNKGGGGTHMSALLTSGFVKQFKEGMNADYRAGAPYGALEDMRKTLGTMLSSRSGIADAQDGELKALYSALSQDMREAARVKGFEHEFDTINNWYSGTRETLNKQAKMLDGYAERVYSVATAGMKQGGSNLQGLKDSLGPGNWNFVRSSVLEKMGMIKDAKDDVHFDTSKFFTDYKNISPDAKNVLFPEPEYRKSLDNLAVISEAMQTTAKAGNTSRTASALTVFDGIARFAMVPAQLLVGGGAAAMGTGGAAIAPAVAQWGISKMLASPTLTKWLATPVKEFGGLDKAVYQLNKITAAQPELADDVLEFLEENRDALEQPSETERAFGGR